MVSNGHQFVFLSNGDGTSATAIDNSLGSTFGTAPSPPQNTAFPVVGDFNGDGKTDWMFVEGHASYVFMSNGNGTFNRIVTDPAFGIVNFGKPSDNLYLAISGDFDGDGRTDFSMIASDHQYVLLSKGDGTFTTIGPETFGATWGSPPDQAYIPVVGDFDGDGKTDWAMISGSTIWAYLSNGDGTFTPKSTAITVGNFQSPPSADYQAIVGDFNGDGKTDWGMISGKALYAFISQGDGTFYQVKTNPAFVSGSVSTDFGDPPSSGYKMVAGDFNGDGKTDFSMIGNVNQHVFLGKGDGTFSYNGPISMGGLTWGTPPQHLYEAIVGDFDGDGKTDWSMVHGSNQYMFLAAGGAGDFVTSIQTNGGHGGYTNITYQPLTKSGVYTKDATAVYPQQDLQGAMYVVSQVNSANGIGGTYTSTYTYAGAKSDLAGRGFLGFRQMAVKDVQTQIVHTTNYNQIFPYLGLIGSETKALGNLNLNQTTNTYQLTNASGGSTVSMPFSNSGAPYRVSVSQNVAASSDIGAGGVGYPVPTVTTTYVYDPYGNVTQVATSTPDGFSKTTTNTYTNDTTNWFLGRLTNATVTSTTP